jgi:hypothetical protein
VKVLPFRRSAPRPIVALLGPDRCTCLVHHLVTKVERNLVLAGLERAKAASDFGRISFLRLQLDNATHCPSYSKPSTEPIGAA